MEAMSNNSIPRSVRRANDFDPPLDPGIAEAVAALIEAGVETFESCEGGPGHAFAEPIIRFYGHRDEGLRALAAAQMNGLRVAHRRRVWDIIDGEPTGPHWELVLLGPQRDPAGSIS